MIVALIDPTVLHDIVALTNTILLWLTPLLLAWVVRIQIKNGKLAREEAAAAASAAQKVAQKVETVVDVTAKSVDKVDKQNAVILDVAIKTHTLVNSQMGQQLMLYAITARTLANLTKDPVHISAADAAEEKLKEHQLKQAVVDNKEAMQKE
jgi:hypothetical protein